MNKCRKTLSIFAVMCAASTLAMADDSGTATMKGSSDLSIGGNFMWGTAGNSGWFFDASLRYYIANSLTFDLLGGGFTSAGSKYADYGVGMHYYLTQPGIATPAPYIVANVLNINGNQTVATGWQYGVGVDFLLGKTASAYVQYTGLTSGGKTNSVAEFGFRFFPNFRVK
jgi:hypothetical protein